MCCTTREAQPHRATDSLVPLAEQDRSLWDRDLIAEGVTIFRPRSHTTSWRTKRKRRSRRCTPMRAVEETDWVQIVEWYDELLRFADIPIVRLNRGVAGREADGASRGSPLAGREHIPRHKAVRACTRRTAN